VIRDGCIRRGSKSESEKKAREYKCKCYFSDRHITRKISKRGKTQGQAGHERAWIQLTKLGLCEPTHPEEQPQQQHTKTADTQVTKVQTKEGTAGIKK
jgi:hypothetical protein